MIGLIDYSMGNLLSVKRALEAAHADVKVISRPEEAAEMKGLLLPGVGNFGDGIAALENAGWRETLREWVAADKPFLGICLGMQLLFDASEEAPGAQGLGIISGQVLHFPDRQEKVPHIGWNTVFQKHDSPFFQDVADGEHFYFVHSYFVAPRDPNWVIGECEYILPFCAAVGKGNCYATQFHPEKSQDAGMQLLKNFVRICSEATGK